MNQDRSDKYTSIFLIATYARKNDIRHNESSNLRHISVPMY